MASPINFGDFIKAIEICEWLIKNCFDPINSANVRYAEFKYDVLELKSRVLHLKSELEKALHQVSWTDFRRYDDIKTEVDLLVGNFSATLEECEALLKKFLKFDGRGRGAKATALDNLFWNKSTQEKVERLRGRLRSHTYKIWLIIEPIQLNLVTGISETVLENQRTLDLLRDHFGLSTAEQLPSIPQPVAEKLQEAVKHDCPTSFDALDDIPLQEGIDILCFHFRECTFQSTSSGIGSTLKEKLSLLKAHWLSQVLQGALTARQNESASLSERIIKQVGQGVEKQYRLRKICHWKEEEFVGLDNCAFAIWPPKPVVKPPILTEPVGLEKKLTDVPLISPYTNQKERLVIFQVNDHTLRTVVSRSAQDGAPGIDNTEKFIDLLSDGFVPIYTVSIPKRWNVNITNGKSGEQETHQFRSRQDTNTVQKSFTGYDVLSHSESISCTVTYKPKRRPRYQQFKGHGEIQMWCWPMSPKPPGLPRSPTTSSGEIEMLSFRSVSTMSLASRSFSGFKDVVSLAKTETGDEVVLAYLPPPPLLTGFVKDKSEYHMWQVERMYVSFSKVSSNLAASIPTDRDNGITSSK
jgi:hypothetical protein